LKGAVPTDELRRRAGQIAAAVPGVARVDNQVALGGAAAPASASDRTVGENFDDKALDAKIHLAFSLNKDLKGTDLSVSSFKRAVTLSGQVDTPTQRSLAVEIAQRVSGVVSVTDQIGVRGAVPAASPGAPDAGAAARAAETAVRANASLAPYSLTVNRRGGTSRPSRWREDGRGEGPGGARRARRGGPSSRQPNRNTSLTPLIHFEI
jgi:hypothetical protein